MHGDTVVISRKSDGRVIFSLLSTTVQPTSVRGYYSFKASLQGWANERIWGLGEHDRPVSSEGLDYKGAAGDTTVVNFKSSPGLRENPYEWQITIQWLVSSRQYGVFFNHPGFGSLKLSANGTEWAADMAQQMDFLITTSAAPQRPRTEVADPKTKPQQPRTADISPYASILHNYYTAIGHPAALPDWALGFWVSKQRYASTTEVIDVARNYTQHGFNVSVFVIDWKHYACQGDWSFTLSPRVCWADVPAMVDELKAMGIGQVFVSLHPWNQLGSLSYAQMEAQQLFVQGVDGKSHDWGGWRLPTCEDGSTNRSDGSNRLYDPSNPRARQFLWQRLQEGYYDHGITNFWTVNAALPISWRILTS
jgi:alpha-D-xyloside xylohydrolase